MLNKKYILDKRVANLPPFIFIETFEYVLVKADKN